MLSTALTLACLAIATHSPVVVAQTFLANDPGFHGGTAVKDGERARTWLPQNHFRLHREGVTTFHKTVSPGNYVVRINLIERDRRIRAAHERIFSIRVGNQTFADIDLWDQAGGHHVPLQVVARVHLPDGKLQVDFVAQKAKTTVASIELMSADGSTPDDDTTGATTLENYSRFVSQREQLNQVGKSDDKSGWVKNAIETASNGVPRMRMDYRVDASLPYGNHARFALPLPRPISLQDKKSLRFMVWPDGSGRRAGVVLQGAKGETATFQLFMDGVLPRIASFSLEHVAANGETRLSDPPLSFAVTAITYVVSSTSSAALGHGQVSFGPVVAVNDVTPLAAAPTLSDFQATPQSLRIAGFENYATNQDLWAHVASTSHGNVALVSLANRAGFVGQGKQSLQVDYTFDRRPYSGVVFMRPMDLRPYTAFRFWLRGDGSQNKLMVFFAIGGIHQFEVPLGDRRGKWLTVPLSSFLGATAAREGMIEIGLWARRNADSAGGTFYVDDIGLVNDPSFANTPAPRPPAVPIPADQITRIDVGSESPTVARDGTQWKADMGFQFGRTHILMNREIENYREAHAQVHDTFRVGMLGYAFAVPNGTYTVKIFMAENWLGARVPGRRVCNIQVGDKKLGDVDIIAETQRRFMPLIKTETVKVSNGVLQLEFRDRANHCKVDALEIVPERAKTPA